MFSGHAAIVDSRPNFMHLFAPAKLNVGLALVGRRDDGFHLLESLFVPLAWGDEMTLTTGRTAQVDMEWCHDAPRHAPLPPQEKNLAFRALEAATKAGAPSAHVRLLKRIPMEAGLGGGSSDAGTLLRALLPADHPGREALARALGADVSFFLRPVISWVTGVGEQVVPVVGAAEGFSGLAFLLVLPPFGAATGSVFQARARQGAPWSVPTLGAPRLASRDDVLGYLAHCRNDLEEAAVQVAPQLREVLQAVRSLGALGAGMSGSGSTCFAVFPSRKAAEESAQEFSRKYRSLLCRTIVAEVRHNSDSADSSVGYIHGNHRSENLPGE